MKHSVIILGILLLQKITIAQNSVAFDQLTYAEPAGWTFADNNTYRTYTNINNTQNTFFIISIYSSEVASGNAEQDFSNAWKGVVAEHFTTSKNPAPQQAVSASGITYLFDEADVLNNQQNYFARLLVFNLKEKTQAVLFLTLNKNMLGQYQPDLDHFISSVQTNKTISQNQNADTNSINTDAATSRFDDGWIATVKERYVLLTKNSSKVLLYYAEKYTDESRDHTVDYFYSHQLAKDYTITNVTARSDYLKYIIEGDATEISTGKKCYVVMCVVSNNGIAKTVAEVSPSLDILKAEVGIDFEKMLTHNKFGVTLPNLSGTWKAASGTSQSYYDYYSGNYVGSNAVVTSDKFIFNSNGSFEEEFKGGTGMVGNMKFYQQHYKGHLSILSPWQFCTTDQDNKVVTYDCWMEAITGGMILHMVNHQYTGSTFELLKDK